MLVLDNLNPLICASPNLPQFLSSLIAPNTSLVACLHSDIPLPTLPSPYSPSPLNLLTFLATTIMTTHSLSHLLAQKAAKERSLPSPVFGLAEETEGVITGMGSNDPRGTVIEMEYRRKSGRGVREWFWLPIFVKPGTGAQASRAKERVILLEDHPLYKTALNQSEESAEMDTTFNLSLTEKQRKDREGVVLPYFDAQREEGVGEGGRILYDMGSEDDFDEEEDEI
jgi:elongator complex protein 5